MLNIIRTTEELTEAPVGTVVDDTQDVLLKILPSGPACWLAPGDEMAYGNTIILLPAKVLRWGAGE